MKLLLHTCCGPCTTGALASLREEFASADVCGLFYNPNIHPEAEYLRRRDAMETVAHALGLPMAWSGDEHGLDEYLRCVACGESRCRACYALRLSLAAQQAAKGSADAFTTTLLISPYQDQDGLERVGRALGRLHGVEFLFRDMRPYYRPSRDRSRELGLYRQNYCGCVFSKLERIVAARRSGRGQPASSSAAGSGEPYALPGLDPDQTARLMESL